MSKNKRIKRIQNLINKKKKIQNMVKYIWKEEKLLDNPRLIGKLVSTHGKSCSCWMCGNPRKFNKEKTTKERQIDE